MAANEKIWVPAPMRVRPVMTTLEWITTPSSMTASAPIWVKGPMRTPLPILAPASTIAVACTPLMEETSFIRDQGADHGLGNHDTADARLAGEFPDVAAIAEFL